MTKVVCFGETMLRLTPPGNQRLVQAKSLEMVFGGAESNVAVSLASYGLDSAFVTKLPDNPIGEACRNDIRRFGVDVSHIARGGDRLGVYYCEKGASVRPSLIFYDRAGSSIAMAKAEDFDWDRILEGAQWFHFTGITPALGGDLPEITRQACAKAKAHGLTVSCDVNYRSKLWSREAATKVMEGLVPFVDLLVNPADIFDDPAGMRAGNVTELEEMYRRMAPALRERFGTRWSAYTLREGFSADHNGLGGMLFDGSEFYKSAQHDLQIVDRVGGGDAFTAGLIFGLVSRLAPQETVEFAAAASALKHTVEGDFNLVGEREVRELMVGNAASRVRR